MTATYVKIIKTLLKQVGDEHKTDIRDKIAETLIDDTVSEYSGQLPYKRRKREPVSSVTDHFNKFTAGNNLGDRLFDKFETERMHITPLKISAKPSITDVIEENE